jgi:hypothetical protein
MSDLTRYSALIKRQPTASYERQESADWLRDKKALEAELDASELAQRESHTRLGQMTAQAHRVAELEFEVARLARLLELKRESPPITVSEEKNDE